MEEVKCSPKCKICNAVLVSGYYECNLTRHLKQLHSPVLKQLVQTLTVSLYDHFEVDLKSYKASCILCYQKLNVFRIQDIEVHLQDIA